MRAAAVSALIGTTCSVLAWHQAFRHPESLPFDTREQLLWAWRFIDASLLAGDPFADYLYSVEPLGVIAVYGGAAMLGVSPFTAAKILPGIFGLFATWQAHRLGTALSRTTAGGVAIAAALNLAAWSTSDLQSATARAFVYPLLPWFLAAIATRRPWEAAASAVLLAFCYPPIGGVVVAVLLAWSFVERGVTPRWSWRAAAIGAAIVALIAVTVQVRRSQAYGPVLTAAEGRALDELRDNGEYEFFVSSSREYWLTNFRTGLFADQVPALLALGAILPLLMLVRSNRSLIAIEGRALLWVCGVSIGFWALAHVMLFRLYQPSRYVLHSFRVATAISVALLFTWLAIRARTRPIYWLLAAMVAAQSLAPIALRFSGNGFPHDRVVRGTAPALYSWLRAQPPDTVVASLLAEANNIPALTARHSLTASDFALPWHTGYHRAYRQRTSDVIAALYSEDAAELRALIARYGISAFLVDGYSYDASEVGNRAVRWLRPFTAPLRDAAARLRAGRRPRVAQRATDCALIDDGVLTLIDAACVVRMPSTGP
jgi:hypothetical protein